MSALELTIGVRDLKRLVSPVIPCAGTDDMLPILTAVRIESRGTHLVAMATDRFRLAIQRVAAPADTTWPVFEATIPARALKSIFATFKPSFRDADPQLVLKVSGDSLAVDADGPLDGMVSAAVSYRLLDGEFPKVRRMLRDALNAEGGSVCGFNPRLIGGVLPTTQGSVAMKIGAGHRDPLVFTDGEDFIAILMPRTLIGQEAGQPATFPSMADWTALLADAPEQPVKKAAARKRKGAAA